MTCDSCNNLMYACAWCDEMKCTTIGCYFAKCRCPLNEEICFQQHLENIRGFNPLAEVPDV
jgi:hypothetical protein